MPNPNILLIEENHKDRASLSEMLEEWGYHVTTAPDGVSGVSKLKSGPYRLVITSFSAPGMDGAELFRLAASGAQHTRILFLSGSCSVENAVEMMKAGAMDFLLKPVDLSQMKLIVRRAFEDNGNTNSPGKSKTSSAHIVTQNKEMLRLLDLAKQVADSMAPVLIQGESGTGKEMFARYVHQKSSRRNGPFVAVNCGALPETLLESELFGHERGAFTGAVSKKLGKFELADGGTLLLDEITEMAVHLQPKLLRVLQEQEIDRVGGVQPVSVDVRVIATTNRNLQDAIANQAFRQDLFYRLNVIPLKIPTLRCRSDDIPLLAEYFVDKYNEIDGRNVKSLTKNALDRLCRLPFSGNVRELENIVERAVLLCSGDLIDEADLWLEETVEGFSGTPSEVQQDLIAGPLKEVEKKLIFHTLDKTDGNRTHAAKLLGISVRTLRNKLNEYKGRMDAI
jgi:two-component system response regulator FlrC